MNCETSLPAGNDGIPALRLAGAEGEGGPRRKFVALDPQLYSDRRWCANCGGPQTFIEVYEFEGGRAGFCNNCGEERMVPFTRSTSEGE